MSDPPTTRREPRPSGQCPCCRQDAWWERPTGGWCCRTCHPASESGEGGNAGVTRRRE